MLFKFFYRRVSVSKEQGGWSREFIDTKIQEIRCGKSKDQFEEIASQVITDWQGASVWRPLPLELSVAILEIAVNWNDAKFAKWCIEANSLDLQQLEEDRIFSFASTSADDDQVHSLLTFAVLSEAIDIIDLLGNKGYDFEKNQFEKTYSKSTGKLICLKPAAHIAVEMNHLVLLAQLVAVNPDCLTTNIVMRNVFGAKDTYEAQSIAVTALSDGVDTEKMMRFFESKGYPFKEDEGASDWRLEPVERNPKKRRLDLTKHRSFTYMAKLGNEALAKTLVEAKMTPPEDAGAWDMVADEDATEARDNFIEWHQQVRGPLTKG